MTAVLDKPQIEEIVFEEVECGSSWHGDYGSGKVENLVGRDAFHCLKKGAQATLCEGCLNAIDWIWVHCPKCHSGAVPADMVYFFIRKV